MSESPPPEHEPVDVSPHTDVPRPLPLTERVSSLRLGVVVIAGSVALQVLTLLSGIASARILGPEGRGVVAFALAAVMFSSQLTFGGSLPVSLAKEIAEDGITARDGWRTLVRRFWWLLMLPAALGAAAFLWLENLDSSSLVALMALSAGLTIQAIIGKLLLAGIQGEAVRLQLMAAVALIPQALFAGILLVALWQGWGWNAADVLLTFAISSCVGLVAWWLCLERPRGDAKDAIEPRRTWSETRANYVGSVKPLDTLGIDRISIGALMGTAALGLYAAAIALANLCGIIGNAVSTVALPHVARAQDDPLALRKAITTWLSFTVGCAALLVVLLQALAETIIVVAFGPDFEGAVEVARWLILADGLFAVRKVLVAILQGLGHGSRASWIELGLTPMLVGGFFLASTAGELAASGWVMFGVALTSCVLLSIAVLRAVRSR